MLAVAFVVIVVWSNCCRLLSLLWLSLLYLLYLRLCIAVLDDGAGKILSALVCKCVVVACYILFVKFVQQL